MFRKILLVLLAALVVIQFIHPKRNTATGTQPDYIGTVYAVPDNVKSIMARACNDCHTNNTRYPWYTRTQPVHWWMNKHVVNGKKKINYDDYTKRSLRYQYHKMEETVEMIKEGSMPLDHYTWMHKDAILTETEKNAIISWANSVMDTMKARYPIDSLIRKK